jgi:hypothetical protein
VRRADERARRDLRTHLGITVDWVVALGTCFVDERDVSHVTRYFGAVHPAGSLRLRTGKFDDAAGSTSTTCP